MRITRRIVLAIGGFACAALLAAGCGDATAGSSDGDDLSGSIVVFAAASLTESFERIGERFEADHPGTKITFSFAASSTLATQLINGAPADVFASADETNMQKVVDADGIDGEPVTFAANALQIIVEPGNPKGITSLTDLAKPGVVVVLAAPEVPVGRYGTEALDKAGVTVTPASYEQDVNAVVNKVVLGEADAGIVYSTDVAAAGDDAEGIEIPTDVNVRATYPIAIVAGSGNSALAAALVDYVTGPEGRRILRDAGFGEP